MLKLPGSVGAHAQQRHGPLLGQPKGQGPIGSTSKTSTVVQGMRTPRPRPSSQMFDQVALEQYSQSSLKWLQTGHTVVVCWHLGGVSRVWLKGG